MDIEMEVSNSNVKDTSHYSSSGLMSVTHIKEEDLPGHEDAGEGEGWIAMEETDGEDKTEENLQAEMQQKNGVGNSHTSSNATTSGTTRRTKVARERNNCLNNDGNQQSNRTKSDLHLDKHFTRARKSVRTTKTSHPSRFCPTDDVHGEKAGNVSVYYCDECSRFFTSKKLYAMHASRHAVDEKSSHSQGVGLERGYLKEGRFFEMNGRRDTNIAKEEQEEGTGIEDSSEIRRRLGLRLSRSMPARFRDGGENHAGSLSEDGNKGGRRRKQLAPRENEQTFIEMESSDDDSASGVDVKKREAKALLRRIRRRRAPKLKNKSPNMCPQCGHCFKKKTDLQRHHRVHSGEKPYACGLCDMRFTRNFGLQCHMRTHAGLKIHACATCGKSYSRRYDLVKHERAVHTGERNHACSDCAKRFVTAQLLRVHERTHTNSQPYLCQECGHRSNHRSDLKKHMRTHTNERPYCCQICKKSFLQSGSLTSHMTHAHGQ